MGQAQLGQRHGLFVYYVEFGNERIYVGQTYNGVRLRLWKHVSQYTPLGEWIVAKEFADPEPTCGIIEVSNNLDMAERYYISLSAPTLNIVQYKTSRIVPPNSRSPLSNVAIERRGGLEIGAISGRKKDAPPDAGIKSLAPPTPADHILDSLYERAYRDPNHPDLRTP